MKEPCNEEKQKSHKAVKEYQNFMNGSIRIILSNSDEKQGFINGIWVLTLLEYDKKREDLWKKMISAGNELSDCVKSTSKSI